MANLMDELNKIINGLKESTAHGSDAATNDEGGTGNDHPLIMTAEKLIRWAKEGLNVKLADYGLSRIEDPGEVLNKMSPDARKKLEIASMSVVAQKIADMTGEKLEAVMVNQSEAIGLSLRIAWKETKKEVRLNEFQIDVDEILAMKKIWDENIDKIKGTEFEALLRAHTAAKAHEMLQDSLMTSGVQLDAGPVIRMIMPPSDGDQAENLDDGNLVEGEFNDE